MRALSHFRGQLPVRPGRDLIKRAAGAGAKVRCPCCAVASTAGPPRSSWCCRCCSRSWRWRATSARKQADAEAMAAMMAAGEPCDGMDPQQPVLCHQHAADPAQVLRGGQAARRLAAGRRPGAGAAVWCRRDEAVAVPSTAASEARPPPDPLFLSTLRLRV